MMYTIYNIRENKQTHNFSGYELIVDGERGFDSFPGRWDPSEAKRHYMRGVPWDQPLRDSHTYTINLDGAYYALAADTFFTTVYAIGPDRQPDKLNTAYLPTVTGSNDARNDAIRSVCLPHTYQDALRIARDHGIYTGCLYTK